MSHVELRLSVAPIVLPLPTQVSLRVTCTSLISVLRPYGRSYRSVRPVLQLLRFVILILWGLLLVDDDAAAAFSAC